MNTGDIQSNNTTISTSGSCNNYNKNKNETLINDKYDFVYKKNTESESYEMTKEDWKKYYKKRLNK